MSVTIDLTVNGRSFAVLLRSSTSNKPSEGIQPDTTLGAWLRSSGITGTKLSCREGGCGACAVLYAAPGETDDAAVSLNSCLRPMVGAVSISPSLNFVCASPPAPATPYPQALCDRASVTTVEGLGGARSAGGYHPLQQALANGNGSQCGFCSPAMVVAMEGLMRSKMPGKPTEEDVETLFDGNICRCTGYRPILQAFRASVHPSGENAAAGGNEGEVDVEASASPQGSCGRAGSDGLCPSSGLACEQRQPDDAEGSGWLKPRSVPEAVELAFRHSPSEFVCAHTYSGIQRSMRVGLTSPELVRIGVGSVASLGALSVATRAAPGRAAVTAGAAVSLTKLRGAFRRLERAERECGARSCVFGPLAEHMARVASVHIRNVGSWAGNLAMAKNDGFASDMVTILAAAGASVRVARWDPCASSVAYRDFSVGEFMAPGAEWDRQNDLLTLLTVPMPAAGRRLHTFKTSARRLFSHPWLNAAMAVTVVPGGGGASGSAPPQRGKGPPPPPSSDAAGSSTAAVTAAATSGGALGASSMAQGGGGVVGTAVGAAIGAVVGSLAGFAGGRIFASSTLGEGDLLLRDAVIVYGAVNETRAVRACVAEAFLEGRSLTQSTLEATLAGLIQAVSQEIHPEPMAQYDGTLAQPCGKLAHREQMVAVFAYKWFLSLVHDACPSEWLPADLATAATPYSRPLSQAHEAYSISKDNPAAPLHEPLHKLTAAAQTAGEAVCVDLLSGYRR